MRCESKHKYHVKKRETDHAREIVRLKNMEEPKENIPDMKTDGYWLMGDARKLPTLITVKGINEEQF